MSIYMRMSLDEFENEFRKSDLYRNKYSTPGLVALYEYFNELDQDVLFDRVKIASEWVEVQDLKEVEDYDQIAVVEIDGGGYMVRTCIV